MTDTPSPEAVSKAQEIIPDYLQLTYPSVRDETRINIALALDAFAKDADQTGYQRGLREGAEREREECAQVADEYPNRDPAEDGNGYWAAEEIAKAIRARKETAGD